MLDIGCWIGWISWISWIGWIGWISLIGLDKLDKLDILDRLDKLATDFVKFCAFAPSWQTNHSGKQIFPILTFGVLALPLPKVFLSPAIVSLANTANNIASFASESGNLAT